MRGYYYLIAGLPMLEFGMKIPVTYEDFLGACKEQLRESDLEVIRRTSISPPEYIQDNSYILREWKRFDTDLRNEIARSRANKKGKDHTRYIRGEDFSNPFMASAVHWAVSQESPQESEIYLDRIRWEKMEELEKGHYFDIDFLIVYALKLQILERWHNINRESGMKALEELAGSGHGQ